MKGFLGRGGEMLKAVKGVLNSGEGIGTVS